MRNRYLLIGAAVALMISASVLLFVVTKSKKTDDNSTGPVDSATRYAAEYEEGKSIYTKQEDESAIITLAKKYSSEGDDKVYDVLNIVNQEESTLYFLREKYYILLYYSQLKDRQDDYQKFRKEYAGLLKSRATKAAKKLLAELEISYPVEYPVYREKENEEIIP